MRLVADIAGTLWELNKHFENRPSLDGSWAAKYRKLILDDINECNDDQSFPVKPQKAIHEIRRFLGDVHGDALKEILRDVDFRLPIHTVFGNADDKSSREVLRRMFPEDFAENDYYSFTHKNCKFISICDAIPAAHCSI